MEIYDPCPDKGKAEGKRTIPLLLALKMIPGCGARLECVDINGKRRPGGSILTLNARGVVILHSHIDHQIQELLLTSGGRIETLND